MRRTQARYPVQARGYEIIADPRLRDHAAIADRHDARDPKAALELIDLRLERGRICRIALEHFNRDRQALPRAEQPIDDLQPVAAMIAAVAILRQRTMVAFEVRRGHVIKHQHAILEMPLGQAVLDTRLPCKEPIQRLIGFALSDMAKTQHIAQARHRRLLIHRTHKAQLRAWRDQPIDHHRYNEIAIATSFGILRPAEDQTASAILRIIPNTAAT